MESMQKGQQYTGQNGPSQDTPAPPYPGQQVGYVFQGAAQPGNMAPTPQYGMTQLTNTPGAGMNTPVPQFVITQQPAHNVTQVVVNQPLPRDVSGRMKCPHCQTEVLTEIKHKPGMTAWLLCILLGVLGIWPCCLIPLFVPTCQDVEHHCPTCQRVIHIYKK